jgi:dipeptide transport system substrate-binding protein
VTAFFQDPTPMRLATAILACLLATPLSAKTLVFCSEGNPEALNPQIVTTTTGMNAGRPMFNNLVEFVPGTTTLRPGLAETWTISPDGTEYVFRLRAGVPFHRTARFRPTRTMNADDVVFSLMRQWRKDHPFHDLPGANYDYFQDSGMPDLLRAIERVDDRTVRIRLARPDAPFLANLAMAFNVVLSAEYADGLLKAGERERLDREPVGTGPFVFAGYQKDVAIRYRAFPEYWRGRQPIDNLVFSITPNPVVRLAKLKSGECHVSAFPSPEDLPQIEADPGLVLLRQEGFNIGYVSMNTTLKPFDDVRVRRAINMAVDKSAIIESVYGNAGIAAKNPIPPTLWSYNDAIRDTAYDRPEALRLLGEAGYPEGFETELWFIPVSRPYNPNGRRIGELIQADLAKIGIRVKLVTEEWSRYRADLQAGRAPMAMFGWTGDNGDPDNFLNVLLGCTAARTGGNNVAKWCDPAYDALVERARQVSDQDARAALYREAQTIFAREAPWLPLAHSVVFMAARKEVTGFKMDPLDRHAFEGVDLKE